MGNGAQALGMVAICAILAFVVYVLIDGMPKETQADKDAVYHIPWCVPHGLPQFTYAARDTSEVETVIRIMSVQNWTNVTQAYNPLPGPDYLVHANCNVGV